MRNFMKVCAIYLLYFFTIYGTIQSQKKESKKSLPPAIRGERKNNDMEKTV